MLEVCFEDVKYLLCMNFVVLKYFLSYGVIVYLYFYLLLNGKDLQSCVDICECQMYGLCIRSLRRFIQ